MKPITGPKQTVIVSCRGRAKVIGPKNEHDNLITLDWHMLTSHDPPMYAISLANDRFSLSLIRDSGVFCVNFLDEYMKEHALNCGQTTGKHYDKFKEFNIKKGECSTIDCPHISDAAAHIECEVHSELQTGDHVIISGKILNAVQNNDSRRLHNLGKYNNKINFSGL